MKNAFGALFSSRKFLTLVFDVVVSTILYFGGKYAGAEIFEDIKWLLIAYQPVFLMFIYTVAKEDVALMETSAFLSSEFKDVGEG